MLQCSCEWCTTPTSLEDNYTIDLPCIIRFGQAKSDEKTAIAYMYKMKGEDVFVIFPDGTKFDSLTSAGKYAHSVLLQKKTSPSNNGWKRWRVNLRFPDKTIKPVVLKTLKDAQVVFENKPFEKDFIKTKSNFCHTYGEKITNKTVLNILINQPMSINKRRMDDIITNFKTKYPKRVDDVLITQHKEDIEEELYSDDDVDLDNFIIDTSKMPGNKDYNDVVYGRKYVKFSHINIDDEDSRFFLCTLRESFHNLKIPKCVLLALSQYKKCQKLEKFRNN